MFRELLTLDEAKKILKQNFSPKPVGTEQVLLSEACERVLAEALLRRWMFLRSNEQLLMVML